jgi:ABC-type glycerol-3-phosphate transport system substrate-binding protein
MDRKRLSRRDFLRVGALTAAGAALAACGPAPTPQVVKETVEVPVEVEVEVPVQETVVVEQTVEVPVEMEQETVTVTIWHHWGGTREPLLAKAFQDFSAYNPDIVVEPTLIPWDQKQETVLTAVAAGEAPDVLMLNASEVPPYAIEEVLVPLDDLISQEGIDASEVYESDWLGGVYQGQRWGLPHTVGEAAWLLFYNKAAFEESGLDPDEPPVTWADLLDRANTLLQMDGDMIGRLGVSPNASGWSWLNYLAENQAEWLSEDGREVLMDNEAAVEALQYIVDISDSQGGPEQVGAFVSALGEVSPFAGGYTAMYFGGVWDYYILKTGAPDLDYGSAVAPNNGGPWNEGNYGPHEWTIPTGTAHLDQAWKLLLWMSRGEGGCDFLTAQLRPSPWKACNENSPLRVAEYWPVIEQALVSTRPEPVTPLFNQFMSVWDQMIEQATYGQMTAGEAVAWGAEEMTRANDEYWGA